MAVEMEKWSFLDQSSDGAVLQIYVQPGSSRNELAGIHQGNLKVRLTSPPVEGQANRTCIEFLAKLLGIPKSRVEILKGLKSRQKKVLIRDVSPEQVQAILQQKGVDEPKG
jgi:uncharacterized protein (TIGR00251 family)